MPHPRKPTNNHQPKPKQRIFAQLLSLGVVFVIGYTYGALKLSKSIPKENMSISNQKHPGPNTIYQWNGGTKHTEKLALNKLTDTLCNPTTRPSIRVQKFLSINDLVDTLPPEHMRNEKCVAAIQADRDLNDWNLYDEHVCRHRFIFVSGMHHSGTSLTNYALQVNSKLRVHVYL